MRCITPEWPPSFPEELARMGVNARLVTLFLAVALSACGSHKATTQTHGGSVTVTTSQDSKSATFQTGESTTSIGQSVDTTRLGAPVYPGAQMGQPASIATVAGHASTVIANFETTDAFDKVDAYYRQRLPVGAEKMRVTSANGSVASFQIGDAAGRDITTVQISSDKPNVTNVLITHAARTRP
jgi:hypothetical protein